MRCYLFDLDGTICDIDHRLHLIHPKAGQSVGQNRNDQNPETVFKPNWDQFFRECAHDKPITPVIHLAHALMLREPVLFVTGRDENVRDLTMAWLGRNVASPALLEARTKLYMRKHGDHRQDHEVKGELLTQIKLDGYDPIMAFEDRDQVVAMWRKAGITCAQVAPGNF